MAKMVSTKQIMMATATEAERRLEGAGLVFKGAAARIPWFPAPLARLPPRVRRGWGLRERGLCGEAVPCPRSPQNPCGHGAPRPFCDGCIPGELSIKF